VCNTTSGVCSNPAKPNDTICSDGNACTQSDTCQAGTCTGANPVVCTASDACHDVGVCDAGTGVCSNPSKQDGTACSDGDACTQTDTCQSGTCTGANPITCSASDQCHDIGVCSAATGVCSNPPKANGASCSDGNACTQTDTCQSGTCTGANPVFCSASDTCHDPGVCNTGTGVCSNPAKPNGSACSDGSVCTLSDSCFSGTCIPGAPRDCNDENGCTNDVCNATLGCQHPFNTAPCDDANACTVGDTCGGGTCHSGAAISCDDGDVCTSDLCNAITAECTHSFNTAPCDDGDSCTANDSCDQGTCIGGPPGPPAEIAQTVRLTRSGGSATLHWSLPSGATASDILSGLLSGLPVGNGSGSEACLADDVAGTGFTDPNTPLQGAGRWYLIRPVSSCAGPGPYGFQGRNGAQGVPEISTTCP